MNMVITFIACTFFVCFIMSLTLFYRESAKFDKYINNFAEKYSLDEIEEKIKEDEELLISGTFKGQFLENILTHKEVWEQIKNHKLKHENTVS